jgi:hypothetical protein
MSVFGCPLPRIRSGSGNDWIHRSKGALLSLLPRKIPLDFAAQNFSARARSRNDALC